MELSADEKQVIKTALERHLEEVQKTEGMANQDLASLSAEVNYEEFVKGIIEKLN